MFLVLKVFAALYILSYLSQWFSGISLLFIGKFCFLTRNRLHALITVNQADEEISFSFFLFFFMLLNVNYVNSNALLMFFFTLRFRWPFYNSKNIRFVQGELR